MRKVLSLFYCSLLLCSASAQQRQPLERIDTFNNNVFKVKIFADTTTMLDPATLDIETIITNPSPVPYMMNAMNIYRKGDVDKRPGITEATLKHYILHKLKNNVTAFGDGKYRLILNSIVISEKGKVAYYDFVSIERYKKRKVQNPNGEYVNNYKWVEIPATQEKTFFKAVEDVIMNTPKYTPAMAGGYPVPFRMSDDIIKEPFYIREGKIFHNK